MKNFFIPLFCFCFLCLNLFADTYVSGDVSGTWNITGHPYRVTANINVVTSSTLTIEDNVQVIFENDYLFSVNGTLNANNAEFSLIDPPPGGVYSWQGIEFTNNSANCIIDSCDFENASPGIVFTNTGQFNYPPDPVVTYNTFNYLNHATADADYALILTDNTSPTIDNNSFEGYIYGIHIDANLHATAIPEITNNEFNLIGLRLTRQTDSKGGVFEGVSNAYLDNNDFLGFEKGLEIINLTETESSPEISNTRLRNSPESSRQTSTGIKIDGTVAVTIDSCDIEDYPYGIRYSGSGTLTRATPTLTNSRVRNSTEPTRPRALVRGVFIDSLISLEIDNCLIVAYDTGIVLLNTSSTTSSPEIANTRVRNSPESSRDTVVGLIMAGDMSSIIRENVFADCDSAIVISGEDTESILYRNNMFLSTGVINNVAIHAEDSNNLDIYNNTIYAYDTGLYANSTIIDFQNNIVWHDFPTVEPVSFNAGVSVQYNDIARPFSNIYPGTGNLNADPLFVDPTNENFYLQWGSPCIDAGNPNIAFQDVDGTTADMGSFFYDQTPVPVILSTFTAQFINSTPRLSWMTATETDNLGWNIYRGEDEIALQSDETIQINNLMIEGAGTTSEPTEYSFFDEYDFTLNFTYWYWLESTSSSGETETYGPISLFIPENEDNPEPPDPSEKFGLFQNYPNPFNPITRISFKLPKEKYAELTIYNVKGEKINTLFKGQTSDDTPLNIYWDACDENAKEVKSGIYLYKLVSGDYVQTRKMIYLK